MYSYEPRRDWDHQTRCEVYRFYLALRTYLEFPNALLTQSELLDGILKGPSYITWLKKARSYVMVNSGTGFFLKDETPDDIKHWARDKRMHDLGDMFNFRYWLFWDQPDEEDWRHFWIPVKQIAQSDLDKLYTAVMSLLPEEIEAIAEEEVLLDVTGSNSLNPRTLKTEKNWKMKQTDNHFTDRPLLGKGSYIQKCPGDTRFSITLSVPHSNTIKLIEKQVALIAGELPWSNYVKDKEEYQKRYDRFHESNDHYLCRDIQKDGITKVRPLIQTVCRALKDKYPNLPACKYFGIFDGFSYIGPNPEDPTGEHVNFPPRGVGLGMSSALTTILQCAIFMITKQELMDERDDSLDTVDALFYHDDAAIGSTSLELLEDYNVVEDRVMARYQQLKKASKSFYAEWFVLCENYSNSYDLKESYQATLLRMCHGSCNISHAKAQWALNLQYVHTVDWGSYLGEIVDHFGYEFYPDESKYPLTMGGWVPAKYMGLDISWNYTEDHTQDSMAAGVACRKYRLKSQRNGKKYQGSYTSPFMQLYGRLDFGPDPEHYLVNLTQSQVADLYTKFDKPGTSLGYWKYQLTNRQWNFKDLRRHRRTIKEWFEMYLESHPTLDVIPPKELMILTDEPYMECATNWRPSNPKLAYLAFLNPGKLPSSIIPYPFPPGMSVDSSLRLTAEERRQLQYTLDSLSHNSLGEPPVVNVGRRYYYNNVSYMNPTAVACYMIATTGFDRIPKMPARKELHKRDTWLPLARILYGERGRLYEYLMERNLPHSVKYQLEATTYMDGIWDALQNRMHMIEKVKAYMQVIADPDLVTKTGSAEGSEYRADPTFEWDDTPLSDGGYWNWTTSRTNYRDWRQKYFFSMQDKITMLELDFVGKFGKSDHHIINERRDEECAFDSVECHLWKCAGGTIVEHNGLFFPQVRGSFFDAPDDPGDEEEVDIFAANSDDSDDDGGLMAGW